MSVGGVSGPGGAGFFAQSNEPDWRQFKKELKAIEDLLVEIWNEVGSGNLPHWNELQKDIGILKGMAKELIADHLAKTSFAHSINEAITSLSAIHENQGPSGGYQAMNYLEPAMKDITDALKWLKHHKD